MLTVALPAWPRRRTLAAVQSRLEEGCAAAGLPQLPAQQFSNEEQMLQQAAQWQRQAAEQLAAARAAAAEASAVATASHLVEDWAPPHSEQQQWASGSSREADGCQQPSTQQVAAAAAALQAEGLPAEQAGQLAAALARQCPKALHDWPGCVQSFAVLQQQIGGGVTWELVVQRTPWLLGMSAEQLARTQQFIARFVGREALLPLPSVGDGSPPSSVVEQMLLLREIAAGAGADEGSQRQQQQAPAG